MKMKFNQKWIAAALILMLIVWVVLRRERYEMTDSQKTAINIVFDKYKLTDEEKNTIVEAIKPIDNQGLSVSFYDRIAPIFVKYDGLSAEIEPFFKVLTGQR